MICAEDVGIHNIYRSISSKSAIASLSGRHPVPFYTNDVPSLLYFLLQDTSIDYIEFENFNLHNLTWGGEHVGPIS